MTFIYELDPVRGYIPHVQIWTSYVKVFESYRLTHIYTEGIQIRPKLYSSSLRGWSIIPQRWTVLNRCNNANVIVYAVVWRLQVLLPLLWEPDESTNWFASRRRHQVVEVDLCLSLLLKLHSIRQSLESYYQWSFRRHMETAFSLLNSCWNA